MHHSNFVTIKDIDLQSFLGLGLWSFSTAFINNIFWYSPWLGLYWILDSLQNPFLKVSLELYRLDPLQRLLGTVISACYFFSDSSWLKFVLLHYHSNESKICSIYFQLLIFYDHPNEIPDLKRNFWRTMKRCFLSNQFNLCCYDTIGFLVFYRKKVNYILISQHHRSCPTNSFDHLTGEYETENHKLCFIHNTWIWKKTFIIW